MSCKDNCKEGVNKSVHVNYHNGYKFCRTCNKYFKQDKFICHCCGSRLRSKPANGARREALIKETRVV